jgi:hypothetical protein
MRSTLRIGSVVVMLVASAAAQFIRFTDFSTINGLDINGPAHQATYNDHSVLRLTEGMRNATHPQASTVWFDTRQTVLYGFTTYFQFQIHNPAACCNPGDGLAFVIQNSPGTSYCGSGAGTTALGVANGGMGYTGIQNSAAIEFDTAQDAWDPNSNHVAVQSCGANNPNSPAHIPGPFPICGGQYNVSGCLVANGIDSGNDLPMLGVKCGQLNCQDGAIHQVVVEYTGKTGKNGQYNLKVYVDPPFIPGTHTPATNAVPQINIPFILENQVALDPNNPVAWVGFTASQASESQTQDLLYWEFNTHQQDTTIQQMLQPPNVQNTFVFGAHVFGATFPGGSFDQNTPVFITVTAHGIDKNMFYQERLLGTQFANEACLTYLETGGQCIFYEVTCQDINQVNVECPPGPDILSKTSYYTADPVTLQNADFLQAPHGTNNWSTICSGFQEGFVDPTTSGKGNNYAPTRPLQPFSDSDLVATLSSTGGQGHCQGGFKQVTGPVAKSPHGN